MSSHPFTLISEDVVSCFVVLSQLILLRRKMRTTFKVTSLLSNMLVGFTGPEMKFQPEVVARSVCRLLLLV